MASNNQLAEIVATTWAALPGGIGAWGIMAGVQQGRIGPVVVGLAFIGLATLTYRIFTKLLKEAQ